MNRLILLATLATLAACNGKEDPEPDSLFVQGRHECQEVRWGQKHAGSDALSYPYESTVGLPYPDGYACLLEKHLQEAPDSYAREEMYTLNRWVTSVSGGDSAGDHKLVTAPMRANAALLTWCPAHGRMIWANDRFHGTVIDRDGRGRTDGWSYRAAQTAGTESQKPQGFVGELFAAYGAVASFRFSHPDPRILAESGVVNTEISEIYNDAPCGLHLTRYLADDWVEAEDVSLEFGSGGAGIEFGLSTHIESDLVAHVAKTALEWGGDGTERSAECTAEIPNLNDNEDGGEDEDEALRSYCEDWCREMTADPVEVSECIEQCLDDGEGVMTRDCSFEQELIPEAEDDCVPGEGIFMALPSRTPSKGGRAMLVPIEIYEGAPGARSVITQGPESLRMHVRGQESGLDFKFGNIQGAPWPLGLTYAEVDPGTEITIAWDCDPTVVSEIGDEPTWLVTDIYGDQDLLVTETWIPHVDHDNGENAPIGALRLQLSGRRDIVTVPADSLNAFMGTEFQWDHVNAEVTFGSQVFSARRLR